jgi:carbonic anhydrase
MRARWACPLADGTRRGRVDHGQQPTRERNREHPRAPKRITPLSARRNRLCELNVMRRLRNVAADAFVPNVGAWGGASAHGWVDSLADGLARDRDVTLSRPEMIDALE